VHQRVQKEFLRVQHELDGARSRLRDADHKLELARREIARLRMREAELRTRVPAFVESVYLVLPGYVPCSPLVLANTGIPDFATSLHELLCSGAPSLLRVRSKSVFTYGSHIAELRAS
jgi:hypothetical protein